MSGDFSALPLHDAPLQELTFDWVTARLTVRLSVFLDTGTEAIPSELSFSGVTRVDTLRENPWGPSVFVNSPSFEPPNTYVLEMQSGDRIRVRAAAFELTQTERRPTSR